MAAAPKKKASVKKASKKKASRKKKDKLGHDPLAWISDEDAEQLKKEVKEDDVVVEKETEAIKPDEIESVVEETQEDAMSEQTIFELPPYFGIAQVAETKESMQSFLQSSGDEIEIEAEDVDSIDTAALQLLTSFIKEAKSKGKNIKWRSTSNKLESSVELLAIKKELGIA